MDKSTGRRDRRQGHRPRQASFSRLGYELRQPTWDDSDLVHVAGRTVVVTGATNGLGRAAAERFAELGARVVLLVRDEERGRRAIDEISAAARLLEQEEHLHVLVNNAGVLLNERKVSVDGYELSMATNLLGPFPLTELLLDRLIASAGVDGNPSRIIEVSSDGMYSQRIDVDDMHSSRREYDGAAVYSRAKRGQVIVTELRAERLADRGVVCHSMHPG